MVVEKKKTKATAEVSIFLQPHDIVNKKKKHDPRVTHKYNAWMSLLLPSCV